LIKNEDVKLNTAENAWKPTAMVKDVDLPEEEAKTAELLKQFRSILNKITPENFKTLIAELKLLKIDTVERLDGCISLVFEKAITEPNYSANYASLCQEVSNVFIVPLDDNNSQQEAVFKKRLITRCQNEFMKHREGDVIKANEDK
jgi:translation initiation factor 4G